MASTIIPFEKLYQHLDGINIDQEELIHIIGRIGGIIEDEFILEHLLKCNCGRIFTVDQYNIENKLIEGTCSDCGKKFLIGGGHIVKTNENISLINSYEAFKLKLCRSRPDLGDVGGLSRAIKCYLHPENCYQVYKPDPSDYSIIVDPNVRKAQNKFFTCAIITGIEMDAQMINIFNNIRRNITWALGNNQGKLCIGINDMENISFPIKYTMGNSQSTVFQPFGLRNGSIGYKEAIIFHLLRKNIPSKGISINKSENFLENIRRYVKDKDDLDILSHQPEFSLYRNIFNLKKFPILADNNGSVFSIPLITGSQNTRYNEDTKEIFIHATGSNKYLTEKALDILVYSLLDLHKKAKLIQCKITYPPEIRLFNLFENENKSVDINPEKLQQVIGLEDFGDWRCVYELEKLMYHTQFELKSGPNIIVTAPPFRIDVKDDMTPIADIAYSHDLNSLPTNLHPTMSMGVEDPIEHLSYFLKDFFVDCGYSEIISNPVESFNLQFDKINYKLRKYMVTLSLPTNQNDALIIMRSNLFHCLLSECRNFNKLGRSVKIFEVGDVVTRSPLEIQRKPIGKPSLLRISTMDESNIAIQGIKTKRLASGLICSPKATIFDVKQVISELANQFDLSIVFTTLQSSPYKLFIDAQYGRQAIIEMRNNKGVQKTIGVIGEINIEILRNYDIFQPTSMFEIDLSALSKLLEW